MVIGVDHKSGSWHAAGRADLARQMSVPFMLSMAKATKGTLDDKRQLLTQRFESFLGAATTLAELRQEPLHLFVEHPLALANGKTTLALGMLAGSLWSAHLRYDLWWHWVQISSWQAMVGVTSGDRTADRKAKARAFAIEAGVPGDAEEDHCDAACMAVWGERELGALPDAWKPGDPAATGRP